MSEMVKTPDIRVTPPGPKAKKVVKLDKRYLATSTKSTPLVVAKAKGSMVWDVDGNAYLDFSSGVSVLNVGHCHPKVTKAIADQAKLFAHFAGTDYYHQLQADLSERLCRLAPGGCDKKIFLSNSGTESIEAAMKLARWSTQRKQFISFINGFHGRTLGSLSLTASKAVQQERYFPSAPGVTRIPYGYCYRCAYHLEYPSCGIWCAKMIEEVHFDTYLPPEEVAAFFLEPVQGEGGYIVPPKEFPKTISKICNAHGILLVDDEVQAGMARTGRFWAIDHFDVVPDILCTAKSLGSGVPIGATIFRSELDWQKNGAHSNTFGGNALACAAGLATLDIVESEKLAEAAERKGRYLNRRLRELEERHSIIGDVRGLGLMQATEFVLDRRTKEPAVKARDAIELLAFKRGLIILGCGKSSMRYIPPLTISKEMLDAGVDVLDGAIRDVSREMGIR